MSAPRFYTQLRQRLAQLLLLKRAGMTAQPALQLQPNPCTSRDVLTMHLIGVRSCPIYVQVRDKSGMVLSERPVFPLSDNHRLPLTLPRECRPGMYQVLARQSTGRTFHCWVALIENIAD